MIRNASPLTRQPPMGTGACGTTTPARPRATGFEPHYRKPEVQILPGTSAWGRLPVSGQLDAPPALAQVRGWGSWSGFLCSSGLCVRPVGLPKVAHGEARTWPL